MGDVLFIIPQELVVIIYKKILLEVKKYFFSEKNEDKNGEVTERRVNGSSILAEQPIIRNNNERGNIAI